MTLAHLVSDSLLAKVNYSEDDLINSTIYFNLLSYAIWVKIQFKIWNSIPGRKKYFQFNRFEINCITIHLVFVKEVQKYIKFNGIFSE